MHSRITGESFISPPPFHPLLLLSSCTHFPSFRIFLPARVDAVHRERNDPHSRPNLTSHSMSIRRFSGCGGVIRIINVCNIDIYVYTQYSEPPSRLSMTQLHARPFYSYYAEYISSMCFVRYNARGICDPNP